MSISRVSEKLSDDNSFQQQSLFYIRWVRNKDGTYTEFTMLRSVEGKVSTIVEEHETISEREYIMRKLKGEI